MIAWSPDFCPDDAAGVAQRCTFELLNDWTQCLGAQLCPFHAAIATSNGLGNQAIFDAVLQSSRVKEAARAAAKANLGLAADHPGVPYRAEADGSFRIGIESSMNAVGVKTWARMPGWPAQAAARNALVAAVNNAVGPVRKPAGTSATVTVD